jgi:hypothetical protein
VNRAASIVTCRMASVASAASERVLPKSMVVLQEAYSCVRL